MSNDFCSLLVGLWGKSLKCAWVTICSTGNKSSWCDCTLRALDIWPHVHKNKLLSLQLTFTSCSLCLWLFFTSCLSWELCQQVNPGRAAAPGMTYEQFQPLCTKTDPRLMPSVNGTLKWLLSPEQVEYFHFFQLPLQTCVSNFIHFLHSRHFVLWTSAWQEELSASVFHLLIYKCTSSYQLTAGDIMATPSPRLYFKPFTHPPTATVLGRLDRYDTVP